MRATQMGPARDLTRVRTSRSGRVKVQGRSLIFIGNDGKQVSISFDTAVGMQGLIRDLAEAAGHAELTDIARDIARGFGPTEEFISPKVMP